MIQAVSMENNFGENLQNVWNTKTPPGLNVINENFGSVRLDTKHQQHQQPVQHQQHQQHQQPVQFIQPQQPVQFIQPQQPVQFIQPKKIENFSQSNGDFCLKDNPIDISLLVTFLLFIFFSWLSICVLIYKNNDNTSGKFSLVVYFFIGVSLLISVIIKLANKCS
jgi:hypothetical protein